MSDAQSRGAYTMQENVKIENLLRDIRMVLLVLLFLALIFLVPALFSGVSSEREPKKVERANPKAERLR